MNIQAHTYMIDPTINVNDSAKVEAKVWPDVRVTSYKYGWGCTHSLNLSWVYILGEINIGARNHFVIVTQDDAKSSVI